MTTRQANQRLVGDLKEVARDAGELVKATAGEAGETVGQLRSRLTTAVESAKDVYGSLGDKTVQTAKATDRCVRGHPYETIGVAFGIGMLIGVLVGRR